jgi:hypothetical protein
MLFILWTALFECFIFFSARIQFIRRYITTRKNNRIKMNRVNFFVYIIWITIEIHKTYPKSTQLTILIQSNHAYIYPYLYYGFRCVPQLISNIIGPCRSSASAVNKKIKLALIKVAKADLLLLAQIDKREWRQNDQYSFQHPFLLSNHITSWR